MKRLLTIAGFCLFLAGAVAFAVDAPASTSTTTTPSEPTVEEFRAQLAAERTRHSQVVRNLRGDIARINRGRGRDNHVPSGNRETARGITRIYFGWTGRQFEALDVLWGRRESGWYHRADNPTSSAYGIPQSLPGSKMAAYGPDWRSNPVTQIVWGLNYIKKRYGTPVNALAHSTRNGWY